MKVTTRLIRNVAFAAFLAAAALAPQPKLFADEPSCGEYLCNICPQQGGWGYTYFFNCPGQCNEGGDCGVSMNCGTMCIWCDDGQGYLC
jgi:hypothetical protein